MCWIQHFHTPLNRYKYEAMRGDTGSGEEIRGISGVVRNCKEIRRVPRRNEEMPGDGRTTLEQPWSSAEAPGLARLTKALKGECDEIRRDKRRYEENSLRPKRCRRYKD